MPSSAETAIQVTWDLCPVKVALGVALSKPIKTKLHIRRKQIKARYRRNQCPKYRFTLFPIIRWYFFKMVITLQFIYIIIKTVINAIQSLELQFHSIWSSHKWQVYSRMLISEGGHALTLQALLFLYYTVRILGISLDKYRMYEWPTLAVMSYLLYKEWITHCRRN